MFTRTFLGGPGRPKFQAPGIGYIKGTHCWMPKCLHFSHFKLYHISA
nr:MAG TPA: hypothetical protein [Caudoviricetes sp.]